jgi:hypothetical protein
LLLTREELPDVLIVRVALSPPPAAPEQLVTMKSTGVVVDVRRVRGVQPLAPAFGVVVQRLAPDVPAIVAWATPHDLRQYCAGILNQSRASVKVAQARLGHASATTALGTYGHLLPDEENRTRTAVDAVLAHPADSCGLSPRT